MTMATRGSWNSDDAGRPKWRSDTRLVAEYEYRRADGSHAFTIRKGLNSDGEKCFSVRRLNIMSFSDRIEPEDKFDHFTGMGVEPAVLFRLPELVEAAKKPGARVLITEGEKDCMTAVELGHVATCNPFGALKWRDEYSPCLAGSDAIVCQDNDDRGRSHAARVVASVSRHALRVRALALPGFKDLTEWKEARQRAGLRTEAIRAELDALIDDISLTLSTDNFWSFGPMNQFFFVPTLALWPAASVDARLRPIPLFDADGNPKTNKKGEEVCVLASRWLSQNRSVETMTWAPGQPPIIDDRVMTEDGGLIESPGRRCFNTYRAPPVSRGDAAKAERWVSLVRRIYPDDADHIFNWGAHRVQKPGDKINHVLVLTGPPGIGKDTLITAIMRAVGTWNCSEANPESFFESFNPHVRAVIMRINEAHDLGDISRYSFYERTKPYAASPPESLAVNDKNIRRYYIPNVVGIIITSNYRTDCLYLPADDRRHYVAAWSRVTKEDFEENFWTDFWKWLNGGGDQCVAAWLASRDISKFDAKAPPVKTQAFWDIVDAGRPTEESELMDALDALKNPDVVTVPMIRDCLHETSQLRAWLSDRRNVKAIGHRLDDCGYMRVSNPDSKDGVWKITGERRIVYAKKELVRRDQLAAIDEMIQKL